MSIITVPLKLPAGFLINTKILGVPFVVPPLDTSLPISIPLPAKLIVVPTDEIVNAIRAVVSAIPAAVVDLFWSPLLKQLDEYYGAPPAEEELPPPVPPPVPPPIPPPVIVEEYVCPLCGLTFSILGELINHVRTAHPEVRELPIPI